MDVLAIPFSVHNLGRLSHTSDKPQWLHSFYNSDLAPEPKDEPKPSPKPTNPPHHLLTLPAEVRLQIYGLVLAQASCFRHAHTRPPYQGTALSLLRVNRTIYHEARLLPFQLSQIAFQKWYGSSMFCCTAFLKSILAWQRREVRTLDLAVNGRELSGWQAREGWLQVCELMSTAAPVSGDVRMMMLTINGTRGFNWVDLLSVDAAWVADGLRKLTSLKTLVIVLSDADVMEELVMAFEESLGQLFPAVDVRKVAPLPVEPPCAERGNSFWNL